MKKIKIIAVLLLIVITAAAAGITVPAAAAKKTVGLNSPGIGVDVGDKTVLSDISVQFESGKEAVSGSEIVWKYKGETVSEFTAPQKGVYTLTAACSGQSKTVYVVAKETTENEYVLYSDDFSTDPTSGLKVVQKTNGCVVSYDKNQKALVLNASDVSDGYIRVLLPEWLNAFADSVITSEFSISAPKINSRWASVMFRVQNENYPYCQVAMRYDTSLANGLEIAERTVSDAWLVNKKTGMTALGTAFRTVIVDVAGNTVKYSVNGKQCLTYDGAQYGSGAFGFQVRGVTMTVKSVKICLNPNSKIQTADDCGLRETRKFSSNVAMGPDLIREIGSADELASIGSSTPAIAVMDVKTDGGKTQICGLTVAEATEKLGDNIIPGYRPDSTTSLNAVVAYLKGKDTTDAYFISDDTSILKKARELLTDVYTVYDVPADTKTGIEEIRAAAVSCGAGTVILPAGINTRENIAYLQDRYLCVWERTDGSDSANVSAINRGVMGLINDSTAATEAVLTKYYPEGTLTRYTNIIGHRGVPSLAQENSLSGCKTAFSKGASMVECDIYLITDGNIAIMHDSTIDRTTDGTGSITGFTKQQLSKYSIDINTDVAKEPIPTLEDYFKEFNGNGKTIVIEYKQNDLKLAKPTAELIKKYGMEEQVVVISFHEDCLTEIRKYLPGVSTGYLTSAISFNDNESLRNAATIIPVVKNCAVSFSPSYQSGTIGVNLMSALQQRGITTWIWTVNKQADFDRYFCMGIRGFTTNYCQYGQDYIKQINVSEENGVYKLTAETYGGTQKAVNTTAKLVVVDDGGTGITFDSKTGTFSGNDGCAKLFFTYAAKTASGTKYYKTSELMTVNIGSAAESTKAEDTTSIADDTGAAEITSGEAQGTTEAEETKAESKSSGCGSVSGFATVAIIGAALIIRKKEK